MDTIDRARAVLSPIPSPPDVQPQSTRSESYLNQHLSQVPHYFPSSSSQPYYPSYEKSFIPRAPTPVRSKASTVSRILPNLPLRRSNASQTPPLLRIIPDYQAYIRSLPPSHFRVSTYSPDPPTQTTATVTTVSDTGSSDRRLLFSITFSALPLFNIRLSVLACSENLFTRDSYSIRCLFTYYYMTFAFISSKNASKNFI